MRIYDARFKYTPSLKTDIVSTWKKFGFKPTTEAERLARQRRLYGDDTSEAVSASVTKLDLGKRKLRAGLLVADKKTLGG